MKRMKRNFSLKLRFLFALLTLLVQINSIEAQCDNQVGCEDCFNHCFLLRSMCGDSGLRNFCRKTCDACPSESETCSSLGCDHSCFVSPDGSGGRCSCFPGYELDANGRTCNDINECRLNETICQGRESPICFNTPGDFICTACSGLKGLWQYYGRNTCCKRRAKTFNQCGYSSNNGKIVRGRFARVARWPWTTAVNTKRNSERAYIRVGNNLCGGSLLTKDWVLTAAHCVESIAVSRITVVMGVLNATNSGNIHEQTFDVTRKVVHPQFSMPDNDIALLRLHRSARLTRYVTTVCLPNGHEPQEGEICYATGFGTTSFGGPLAGALQEVDLPIAPNNLCEATYANTSNRVSSTKHICAGYEEGGKDACQGDSGGPLVCQRCDNCDWYVAGITSFGRGCGRPGFYGVYTRVKYYEEWITQITDQDLEQGTCVRPTWHPWGPWTNCSANCGEIGSRRRVRSCENGEAGDPDCIGDLTQTEACNGTCRSCDWTTWGRASCSQPCGGGLNVSVRRCIIGEDDEEDDVEERTLGECNMFPCRGQWEEWGPWSCELQDDLCLNTSTRVCNQFGIPVIQCEGDSTRTENFCDSDQCASWSVYNNWSSCAPSCGGGTRMRRRVCLKGTVVVDECKGSDRDIEDCNTDICPTPTWDNYGPWSTCSITCGAPGTQSRTRRCLHGMVGQGRCIGPTSVSRPCNTRPPPCRFWGDFGPWSLCSRTCGPNGRKTRMRSCMNGNPGQPECEGPEIETVSCNNFTCPRWGDYGPWGECSVTCEGGTQRRTRECMNGTVGQIGCEGSSFEDQNCSDHLCPSWSDYGSWGSCNVTCGGGSQRRTRVCMNGFIGQIGCDGSRYDYAVCNSHDCWDPWQSWSGCSVTCGSGIRTSSRTCNGGLQEASCIGPSARIEVCNTQICPRWSIWSDWSMCGESDSTRSRSRTCLFGQIGQAECIGDDAEEINCPRWGNIEVNDCSKTCDNGTMTTTRECLYLLPGDTAGCEGPNSFQTACNTGPCPYWGAYMNVGTCSVTCGGGMQRFERNCINGNPGDVGCEGSSSEMRRCNPQTCDYWGEWSEWGDCNRCSGNRDRIRECIGGTSGSGNCVGSERESERCEIPVASRCSRYVNELDDNICQARTAGQWCVTFHLYMRDNCAHACCEAGQLDVDEEETPDCGGPDVDQTTTPQPSLITTPQPPILPQCRNNPACNSFFFLSQAATLCQFHQNREQCPLTCGSPRCFPLTNF